MSALDWLRRKNAEGIVLQLARSADPAETLRRHVRQVDDMVVDALISVSYQQADDGELQNALRWAELAEEASLLRGTTQAHAQVSLCRSTVLWHIADALPKETDLLGTMDARGAYWRPDDPMEMRPGPQALAHLKTALEAADKALAICEQAGLRSLIPDVRHRQAVIHAAAGERVAALQDQIQAVLAWTGVPGSVDPPAQDLGNVAVRYWNLRTSETQAGAQALGQDASALLVAAALWPRGPELAELREALGDACEQTGDAVGALDHWEHAATAHQHAGVSADEYRVRRRMQHLAHIAGGYQRALTYGEACTAIARAAGVPVAELGHSLHNLAATHRERDDWHAAIATYREATELLTSEPDAICRTDCLLELGLLEIEHTLFQDARHDLEQVLESSGTEFHYWIADTALAELCLRHLGDLDAATRHADQAVDATITSHSATKRPGARVYSLHLSGMAHAAAGGHDTAIRRFEQAIQISTGAAEPLRLIVSRYYRHEVTPPSLADLTALAFQVCQAAGRTEDARHYLTRHVRAAEQDTEAELPEPTGDQAFDEGIRAFRTGMRLEHADPAQAAQEMQRAVQLFADDRDPEFLVTVYTVAGRCLLRNRDYGAARTCFERALALAGTESDLGLKLTCADGLAAVWLHEGDIARAYEHAARYVDLTEQYRSSLPTAEDRIRFLRGQHIAAYTVLVYACARLGRTSEALETLELIKSRTLTDMLSRAQHRPIDYTLADQATRLRQDREQWLDEFSQQFYDYSTIGADYENSDPHRMMSTIIDLHQQGDEVREQLQSRNALDRIDAAQERLKTSDIRSLLHP